MHTIDPAVDVLRVDKLGERRPRASRSARGRTSPTTAPSSTPSSQAYSGDHHAAAWRHVRRAGAQGRQGAAAPDRRQRLPQRRRGRPDGGHRQRRPGGRRRASATSRPARCSAPGARAGKRLDAHARRSTGAGRGRASAGARPRPGPVDAAGPASALGFLTGSEEGRGPLFDITGVPFEGRTVPDRATRCRATRSSSPARQPAARRAAQRLARRRPRDRRPCPARRRRRSASRIKARRARGARAPRRARRRHRRPGRRVHPVHHDARGVRHSRATRAPRRCAGPNTGDVPVRSARRAGGGARERAARAEAPYELDPATASSRTARPYPAGRRVGDDRRAARGDVERLRARDARLRRRRRWGATCPLDRAFITAAAARRRDVAPRTRTTSGMQFLWRADADGRYTVQWEVPLRAPAGRVPLPGDGRALRVHERAVRGGAVDEARGRRRAAGLPAGAVVNEDLTPRPRVRRGDARRTATATPTGG